MNNGQLDLFAGQQIDYHPIDKKQLRIENARKAAPEGIAIVFTATESGNSSGAHFFLTVEDAMKLCQDSRSKGVLHGTKWAFFWTSLKNYCGNYWDLTDNGLDLSDFFDNGSRDDLLNELGIKKIPFEDVVDELEKNGIRVITALEKHMQLKKRLDGK